MLRSLEWTEWLDAKQRCLWVHGIPGAGKTVLMCHLFEQVEQHCENSQNVKLLALITTAMLVVTKTKRFISCDGS